MIISRKTQQELDRISEATFCIIIGTLIGLITYEICLIIHLDIFGWNLGLIFSPLTAGYFETYLAKKYMRETTGAVSAFILFAVTTIYSFILTNSTLGVNVITIGSIFVILQAALPTLINYFIIIIILSVVSYISGIFKKITNFLYKHSIRRIIFKKDDYFNKNIEDAVNYDSTLDININNLDIKLLTITPIYEEKKFEYKGIYEGKVIYQAKNSMNLEKDNKKTLSDLSKVKNQAILNLTLSAKEEDCNAIIDLKLTYEVLDNRGSMCLVTAYGTGIHIN